MRIARRLLLAPLLFTTFSPVWAQDARNFGMGGVGTAVTEGPTALLWNPALLYFSADPKTATVDVGASAVDSTNLNDSALNYSDASAATSGLDDIRHSTDYRGFVGIQIKSYGAGISHEALQDHELTGNTAQFLQDRSVGVLTGNYNLNLHDKESRVDTLSLAISQNMPLGQASAALGATLKIHQGNRLRQSDLTGSYQPGLPAANFDRWSSTSGSGFSWDLGALVKPSPNIAVGAVIENVNSTFKWNANHQILGLDPATGMETPISSTLETLAAPMEHAVRFGFALMSEDQGTAISADSRRAEGSTLWRFGYERSWAPQHLAIRLGTYRDPVSDRRVITGGAGYLGKNFKVQLAVSANHWPVVQDSSAFGAALDFSLKL